MPPFAFINYRRTDSRALAFLLRNELTWRFGDGSTFIDVGDIVPGTLWPDRIRKQLERARVCLVVIGTTWLKAADEDGRRRLDKTDDWVRLEIQHALAHGNPIIPILVSGQQKLPRRQALPDEIAHIVDYQGIHLEEQSWDRDVGQLIRVLIEEHGFIETKKIRGLIAQNPTKYLTDLSKDTALIEIRGIQVGQKETPRFPIEDLFISLTVTQARSWMNKDVPKGFSCSTTEVSRLENALRHDRLLVIGDPGSGKTTFVRRVAQALCSHELRDDPKVAQLRLGIANRLFPILISVGDLARYLKVEDTAPGSPAGAAAPAWLPHFLAAVAVANHSRLSQEFFARKLEEGEATVLFDGLDEVPNQVLRDRVSQLIENVTRAFAKCRFVVTTRPGDDATSILPSFAHVRINPVPDEAIESFLWKWCTALYVESELVAKEHLRQLLAALRTRPEVRRMARTPVMLTALAVVHWNERCMPQLRAELFECVLRWLARSRQQKPGRETPERALELLRELAMKMQSAPQGFQKQVSLRKAAELLTHEFGDQPDDHKATERAETFLIAEQMDSGIIVARGSQVQFWHRSFQDYLAARAIAARTESGQKKLLCDLAFVCLPEWRDVMPLLAGVLHQHGRDRVDNLMQLLLSLLGENATLAEEASIAGLMGIMLRDLPDKYNPPATYYTLLERVGAIFTPWGAAGVPLPTRIEAADALGQTGDPRLDFHDPNYWVTIPASVFLMGAQKDELKGSNYDKEAEEIEAPVHEIKLDAFQLARYPVTVGQYQQFIEDGAYDDRRWWGAGGFNEYGIAPAHWDLHSQYLSRPVVGVSWHEAVAFCNWVGFRLPTEAEWERAARGTCGRKFPWGDEAIDPTLANFASESLNPIVGHLTPVGIYPLGATPEGICDLAGNVWEWCASWFAKYGMESVSKSMGSETSRFRVLRGGSWYDDESYSRSANRNMRPENYRDDFLGFRLARTV